MDLMVALTALGFTEYEAKVYLASSAFNLQWTAERNPEIKFVDIKTTTV